MNSAKKESVVYWRIVKLGALDSEFDEIMPLFTICFPENAMHFIKQQPEAARARQLNRDGIGNAPAF